jgi:hypothetical protein
LERESARQAVLLRERRWVEQSEARWGPLSEEPSERSQEALPATRPARRSTPTVEDAYWRENYINSPYYRSGVPYSDYQPAYRYGWESASRREYAGKRFDEVESDLARGWSQARGTARATWEDSREATRDAWNRVRRGN